VTQAGSVCAEGVKDSIYNHVLFFSGNYQATEKLNIFADLTFTYSASHSEKPEFGPPPLGTYQAASPVVSVYYYTDFSYFNDYFDLRYKIVDTTVGFNFDILKNLTFTANFRYAHFDDAEDDHYVYGDQYGDLYEGNIGLIYKF